MNGKIYNNIITEIKNGKEYVKEYFDKLNKLIYLKVIIYMDKRMYWEKSILLDI